MMDFSNLTYRRQVRVLRKLASVLLKQYPFTVKKIDFINYGENATFRVTDLNDKKYLLRICRNNYHTKKALLEELRWLRNLTKLNQFQVPEPVLSKAKKLVVSAVTDDLPEGRRAVLFKWTEGRFLEKSISVKQMTELGQFIANLHLQSAKEKSQNRRYWNAEGLVGLTPKFGSIDQLKGVSRAQQATLTRARRKIFRKLKAFEKRFPDRMGLIHADMHTGNFLFNSNGIVAIDFDDCGFGFFGYDVAIPIMSLDRFKGLGKRKKEILKEAFLTGYRQVRIWDGHDERMLSEFIKARHLLMLGWLNSRRDNPRLKKYFKRGLKRALIAVKAS